MDDGDENKKKRMKISVVEETSEDIKDSSSKEDGEYKEEITNKEENKSDDNPIKNDENIKKNDFPANDDEVHVSLDDKKYNEKDKDKMPFWIMFLSFIIGLSLGIGLIGGLFYYKSKVENLNTPQNTSESISDKEITNTEDDSNTPTPTQTPFEKPDLSKITVQILNGSGISGEASKVKSILEDEGFSNIKTGNATRYDYKDTEISIKDNVDPEVSSILKSALSDYSLKESTSSSSTYDLLIIVGSTKK